MSYPQGPQQRPPTGNGGNRPGNGNNPFNKQGGNDNGQMPANRPFWQMPVLWLVVLGLLFAVALQLFSMGGPKTIDTKDGFDLLSKGEVTYAEITEDKQVVTLKLKDDFTKTNQSTGKTENMGKNVQFYYVFAQGGQVVQAIDKANPSAGFNSIVPQTSIWSSLLVSMLPLLIIMGVFWFFMSRMQGGSGGLFGMGGKKNSGKLLDGKTPKTKFADVAGEAAAVQEVEEIKDFLKDPSKYKALGARIPRGVLLYGPPGTGKTLLARAIAGEAAVPFYSMAGSDFVEMFVGLGASRVRDLFEEAKKTAPAIIFIDEIDAVGRRRGSGMGGGYDEPDYHRGHQPSRCARSGPAASWPLRPSGRR